MNSLASLVDSTLVSHAPFQAAVREIETCFEFAQGSIRADLRCTDRTVAHGKITGAGRLRTAASQGSS